jgi:hypothetical protein
VGVEATDERKRKSNKTVEWLGHVPPLLDAVKKRRRSSRVADSVLRSKNPGGFQVPPLCYFTLVSRRLLLEQLVIMDCSNGINSNAHLSALGQACVPVPSYCHFSYVQVLVVIAVIQPLPAEVYQASSKNEEDHNKSCHKDSMWSFALKNPNGLMTFATS